MKKLLIFLAAAVSFSLILICFAGASESSEDSYDTEASPDLGLSARAVCLMEASTGQIIYSYGEDEQLSPASITKIMTLILVFDAISEGKISLEDEVTVSAYAKSMGGSQVYLEEGEVQTVETLIKCIIIASANDASVAMAEYICGSETEFVRKMNERADGLGMTSTYFTDCCGLTEDPAHVSSAKDVAVMSRELITRYPQIFDYSTIWMENITHTTSRGASEFCLTNTNKLLKMTTGFEVTGLKTGSTSLAKYCVSATARKDGIELIAVVMASENYKLRFSEAAALLNYGYANCKLYTDTDMPELSPLPVTKGIKDVVSLEYGDTFSYLGTNGEDFTAVKKEISFIEDPQAPISKGDVLGKITYSLNGKELGSVDIKSGEDIRLAGYSDFLFKIFCAFCV